MEQSTRRNAACPCGNGKRYKDCHGKLAGIGFSIAATAQAAKEPIDFVIAGAQKAGTTALDLYLRDHPGVAMAARKELHFFDVGSNFLSDPPDYTAYHAQFPPASPGRLRGESTPIYMYWPPVTPRLARYNPALKLIVVLRNPITRAYSHWNMSRRTGEEKLSFIDALHATAERARLAAPAPVRSHAYVERGFYARQLLRLWEYFPVEQTLILRTDDLLSTPDATLARIADFLHLPPFTQVIPKIAHARRYEREMDPDERRWLVDVFAGEIEELERLLGWNCSNWLN